MYVYEQIEPWVWTVGHYDPTGRWHPESDHAKREDAANRVAWLNGRPSGSTTGTTEARQ
ncbi:hypothetical protein [Paraburkholderia sp. J11-2]|uniref:hypothetical protein n=1 Tax=Paraburkholderia sp. J11-2 TaxID=2805431 RepID=UPI002AB7D07A|nr:hypothetical protein [Paraburkholderia sp. J11-2]